MDFTTITVEVLKQLSHITGNYGLAIIFLTVLVRLAMWPLSVSQQRSMKKMQTLSPKLKEIQNRYKSNPQMMQAKMMEFYKENKFNPFGGCFPLLLQMPVFILLYTALMSPQFDQIAGKSSFLFINSLNSKLHGATAPIGDNKFAVEPTSTFSADKKATVYMKGGKVQEVQIEDAGKAVKVQGSLNPGKPIDLKVGLDNFKLTFEELEKVEKAEVSVINNSTKETEKLNFERRGPVLATEIDTTKAETTFHYDVLVLIALFGITMFFSQKYMSGMTDKSSLDPAQRAMQEQMGKMMPIMITGMFIFFPIPAGVLLYMVTSNIIQVGQTIVIDKMLAKEEEKEKNKVDEKAVANAKKVDVKKEEDKQKVIAEQNNSENS